MTSIVILSLLGMATLFTGVYKLSKLALPLVVIGVLAALVTNFMGWNQGQPIFSNMLWFDNYAVAFSGLLMVLAIFLFLISDQYYRKDDEHVADIYALILFTVIGGIQMAAYYNLTVLFVGLETLSISLYILAGSRKLDHGSNEASLKYFLMGSFSTGFLLFGIALIYGSTGTLELTGIRDYVMTNKDSLPIIFQAGLFLMLVGLTFKVSAVPFHFWAPDVYQGSPTIVTAFMATVGKTAAFAALFRLMFMCFNSVIPVWFEAIWVIAALTIIVGNLSAINQKSVKRMLAYSSVANAGYLMIGVLAMNDMASSALFYYTAAYSLATIVAFSVLMLVQQARGSEDYDAFRGLAKKHPFLATILIIAMLSLAGIPPMAGFFAKYYIFANAIYNNYLWIVIIAVLGSLVGVYYYFKVIVALFQPSEEEYMVHIKGSYLFALGLAALLIIALGVAPGLLTGLLK